MTPITQATLHRTLSDAQVEKRQRIVRAGIALAREHGYDGFSTRDVAKCAGVAIGTVYNNFTSKDHLLAEALLEWLAEFDDQLIRERLRGKTIAARLVKLFERMAVRASRDPELYEALRRAMMSSDPSTSTARRAHIEGTRRWFKVAIGDVELDDQSTLFEVLEYIFAGAFLVTPAKEEPKALIERLERSVRFVAPRG